MGIFSFGKKDDAAPRRRGAEAGSGRRSSQSTRVERRSRRPDRSGDAEAMLLDPTLPEKQRARRRLVGAIALVVAAIVILPMVLDSHPKPVTGDIAIDIPARPAQAAANRSTDDADDAADTQAGVAPDNPGASGLSAAPAASTLASNGADKRAQAANQTSTQAPTQTAQAEPNRANKPASPATSPAALPTTSKPNAQQPAVGAPLAARSTRDNAPSQPSAPARSAAAAATATADSGTPAAPSGARYAVQLGAFSNESTARNWVTKLKAAGVPAYTEQRKQADGSTRTLLRAGPFPDRASASEAIAKVRGAGLMAGSNSAAE